MGRLPSVTSPSPRTASHPLAKRLRGRPARDCHGGRCDEAFRPTRAHAATPRCDAPGGARQIPPPRLSHEPCFSSSASPYRAGFCAPPERWRISLSATYASDPLAPLALPDGRPSPPRGAVIPLVVGAAEERSQIRRGGVGVPVNRAPISQRIFSFARRSSTRRVQPGTRAAGSTPQGLAEPPVGVAENARAPRGCDTCRLQSPEYAAVSVILTEIAASVSAPDALSTVCRVRAPCAPRSMRCLLLLEEGPLAGARDSGITRLLLIFRCSIRQQAAGDLQ